MVNETALVCRGVDKDREAVHTALATLAGVWETALATTEQLEAELQENRGLVRALAERLQATQGEVEAAHLSLATSEDKCAKLKTKVAAWRIAVVLAGGGAVIINLIGWWVI